MKYVTGLALAALCLTSLPALAMTDESSHYNSAAPQANMADPDDRTEMQQDQSSSVAGRMSGREQTLIGNSNTPQTYGFNGSPGSYGGNDRTGFYSGFNGGR